MAIPMSVEDVLDPKVNIDPGADNAEIEAWLCWLPPAVHRVYREHTQKKLAEEDAKDQLEITMAQEMELMDDEQFPNVTAKKIALKGREKVINASKAARDAKLQVGFANAAIEMVKERSGSVRKIATIRANTQHYAEDVDYSVSKRRNNFSNSQNLPMAAEHPEMGSNSYNVPPTNFQPNQSSPQPNAGASTVFQPQEDTSGATF